MGNGEEVITRTLTFCGTANRMIHTGGAPVFVDIEPATLKLDGEKLEEGIRPETKAKVGVQIAGQRCEKERKKD
ncbi:DegT/DnrJ/EryC1/StrS family aminotransferase, partial [Bacillus pumilus]|uniref:DegT/DnrJ/EryC1/StrS family aminotransferase n=1 Tax=Bacillus pumilus TaxID=1408 RepID=UPI0021B2C89C